MGCGASRSQEAVVTDENVTTCFETRDPNAPVFVSDTGAGAIRRSDSQRLNTKQTMLLEAMPPGTLPEQSRQQTGFNGNNGLTSGDSLIMKHPPRKPQRLEEKQTLMTVCSPKHKLVSSTGRINQKPSVQDVPEEDEDVEEEERVAAVA